MSGPNTPDSYAPIIADVAFLVPSGSSTGVAIDIPAANYLQSIETDEFSDGAWTAKLTLFDPDETYLTSLLFLTGANQKITFRFGWDQGSTAIANLPLYVGQVCKVSLNPMPEGLSMEFEIVGADSLTNVLDKTLEPRSFPAGMTATDIFRKIAAANNWVTRDPKSPNTPANYAGTVAQFGATVEETAGTFPDAFQLTKESHISFIRETLIPRSANSNGDHFIFFFDRGNVAHFHSVKHSTQRGAAYTLAAEYIYARDPQGEVIEFKPADDLFSVLLLGGGNAKYVGKDAAGGERIEVDTTSGSGAPGAKQTIVGNTIGRGPTVAGITNALIALPARDNTVLKAMAAAQFSRLSTAAYTASLSVRGTHAVQVNDIIKVRYIQKDGNDHWSSGFFFVASVHQTYGTDGWTTHFSPVP